MRLSFRSLRARLIVLLAVLVLVPVLVGFTIYGRAAGRLIEQQLLDSQGAVLSQTVLNLNRIIGTLSTSVNYLSSSSAVQQFIAAEEQPDDAATFFAIRGLQETMRLVSTAGFQHTMSVFFLTPTGFVSTIVDTRRNRDEFLQSLWFRRASAVPERIHWTLETQRAWTTDGFRATPVVTSARAIRSYDGSTVAGVAAVSIEARDLISVIDPRMVLRDGPDVLLEQEPVRRPIRVLSERLENGWTIEFPLSAEELLGDLGTLQRQGIVLVILLSVLLSAGIVLNVFSATRSLLLLRHRVEAVEAGDLSVRMPRLPGDEVGLLASQFNRMLDQIQQLFEQVRQEHALAEEARLARLRSQIRPHFLLNSLNSVNWAARMSGAHNVSRIVAALSAILERSLYERESFVPVSRELETTGQYLVLEQLRSGDRWEVDIDRSGLDGDPFCPVFCIQPLLENAIQHAMPPDRQQMLHVVVSFQTGAQPPPGILEITVEDDGAGFAEAPPGGVPVPLPSAESAPNPDAPGGIGLRNIHERIRNHFGPEWGVSVEPRQPRGSRVRVVLPYLQEPP